MIFENWATVFRILLTQRIRDKLLMRIYFSGFDESNLSWGLAKDYGIVNSTSSRHRPNFLLQKARVSCMLTANILSFFDHFLVSVKTFKGQERFGYCSPTADLFWFCLAWSPKNASNRSLPTIQCGNRRIFLPLTYFMWKHFRKICSIAHQPFRQFCVAKFLIFHTVST